MAEMEFTILCGEVTPEDIQDYINSLPETSLQTRGNDWRVSYGFGEDIYLDIMYLEELNSQNQWSAFQSNLIKFITENENSPEKQKDLKALIKQQTFGLTVLAEPPITDLLDNRILAIRDYLGRFGTVLLSDYGLFDCQLNPIASKNKNNPYFIEPYIQNCTLFFPSANITLQEVLSPKVKLNENLQPEIHCDFTTSECNVQITVSQQDLDQQKNGFKGFVARLPNSGAQRSQANELIDSFQMMNGIILSEPISMNGETFQVLIDLIKRFNGFMFVNNSIMLPDKSYLVGSLVPKADNLEHPESTLKEINLEDYRHEGPIEGIDPARVQKREEHYRMLAKRGFKCARWMPLYRSEEILLRPVEELTGRTLALQALFFWVAAPEEIAPTGPLKDFISRNSLKEWLTAEEKEIINTTREEATEKFEDTIGWKLENLWSLSWILGFKEPPLFYKGQIDSELINEMLIGFLPGLECSIQEFTQNTQVRTTEEVDQMEDLFYCTHNAVRSAQVGSSDAVPPDFHPVFAGGAIHERRHSLTWALSPDVDWEDTELST